MGGCTDVTLAKTAGFCFGVKRAVDMVYKESEENKEVYTFGPIIHNEEVVSSLEKRGVSVINNEDELKELKRGTIIIRSHGVQRYIYDIAKNNGLSIVDATCPFVKKIHKIVDEYSSNGYQIVIIGSDNHPEVEGIKGWCNGEAIVIESKEQIGNLLKNKVEKLCIVSQTTFNHTKFQELVEIISKKGYDICVLNTICNATEERQKEASELADKSDTMIVIGGKHSSNTQKLFGICKNKCDNTLFIQTLDDLNPSIHALTGSIGITAGASTPNNIIEEVYTKCQTLVSQNY
jgi:4-hydroxy-3-methylbut-2-enyl diphosphate reductase